MWDGGRCTGFGGRIDTSDNLVSDTQSWVVLFDDILWILFFLKKFSPTWIHQVSGPLTKWRLRWNIWKSRFKSSRLWTSMGFLGNGRHPPLTASLWQMFTLGTGGPAPQWSPLGSTDLQHFGSWSIFSKKGWDESAASFSPIILFFCLFLYPRKISFRAL